MAHWIAVDPNLLVHSNGLHLSWGSWWDGIFQVPLSNPDTLAQDPPGTHLAGYDGRPAEGAFVYKSPSTPFFFLFFSDGITPLEGVRSFMSSHVATLTFITRPPNALHQATSTRFALGVVAALPDLS